MQPSKNLVFVHLLNDYSGSPIVLSHIVSGLGQGYNIDLFISNATADGVLSNIDGVKYHSFFYKWSANPLKRLFYYSISQVDLFFKIMKYEKQQQFTLYINTLLPFGAALAGRLKRVKVVYHVHEAFISPKPLNVFLKTVVKLTANKAIYVSKYLFDTVRITRPSSSIISNTLPAPFCKKADEWLITNQSAIEKKFTVLMLCSLKKYKGIDEFVLIAKLLPAMQFVMVINDKQEAIDLYYRHVQLPANLMIHSMQKDVHPFYQEASVLLNLTNSKMRVETFGMTVLEGMYYHLPVIVPEVGGIAELVEENVNGFKCPCSDINSICNHLNLLQTRKDLYAKMALAARKKAEQYTHAVFINAIEKVIN